LSTPLTISPANVGTAASWNALLQPATIPAQATLNQDYTAVTFSTPALAYNVTYSLRSGSLPNGMTLSTYGVLQGRPTHTGTYNFSVKYTLGHNGTEYTGYRNFSIQVPAPTPITPPVTPPTPPVTPQCLGFVCQLNRVVNSSSHKFTDVGMRGQGFEPHIAWLYRFGITTGKTPTSFAPNDNVTRAQMAAFIYRLSGSPSANASTCGFADVPSSSPFAKNICWLKSTGITTGKTSTSFAPNDNVTRAQMAAFMKRLYDYAQDKLRW
jgi:hypothetical protein